MGQCAVVPPSPSGEYEDYKFLVVHRPDRATRCILDRGEVDMMLLHQSEAMTRQTRTDDKLDAVGIAKYRSAAESFSDDCDESDSDSGDIDIDRRAPSQATTSFTAVTNDTDATMLVSNLDRYAMKAKLRNARISRLQEEKARERDILHAGDSEQQSVSTIRKQQRRSRRRKKRWNRERRRSRSTSSSSSFSSRGSDRSDRSVGSKGIEDDTAQFASYSSSEDVPLEPHRRRAPYQRSTLEFESPLSAETTSGSPYNGLVTPCFAGQLGDEVKSKRSSTNVLNLRMGAKLSDFYRNHYVRLCPDDEDSLSSFLSSGIPQKRPEPAPTLASVSSDGSSSRSDRSMIDLFAGVPSSPVNLAIDGTSFLDMAVTGSLGLVDRKRGRPSRTSHLSTKQKSPEHYIVLLHRRSGIPLAICALKSLKGSPVVRIYATKQRVFGQRHAATTKDLGIKWSDALPLYAWAEIVTDGEFPGPQTYAIYMSTGSDARFEKEPSYRATHASAGSADISVVGRTELEREYKGCATISVEPNDENDVHMALSISRGIDPALFICFSAIVDEVMEKNMRLHCNALQKTEIRRRQAQKMDF